MSSPTTRFRASLLAELLPKRKFGYALPYFISLRLSRTAYIYSSNGLASQIAE
ncbi:MAG: hypothetical protein ACOC3E_01890 [Cyanobacteriota bacterium]